MTNWYFHQENGRILGPISLAELQSRVREGRIKPADLVHKEDEGDWKLASELGDIKSFFSNETVQEIRAKPWICLKRKTAPKEAKVFSDGFTTVGPFSTDELRLKIQAGAIKYTDYAWRDGFSEWTRLGLIPEFNSRLGEIEREPAESPIKAHENFLDRVVHAQPKKALDLELTLEFDANADKGFLDLDPPGIKKPNEKIESVRKGKSQLNPDTERKIPEEMPPVAKSQVATPQTNQVEENAKQLALPVQSKRKRSKLLVDWGIVLVLILAVGGVIGYYLPLKPQPFWTQVPPELKPNPLKKNQTSPSPEVSDLNQSGDDKKAETTTTKVEPGLTGSSGLVNSPFKESSKSQVIERREPSELFVAAQAVGSDKARIEIRTNGSPDIPVYIQAIGAVGQVLDSPAYYKYLRLKSLGDPSKPLDLSELKLPQGKFVLRVETGALNKEVGLNLGTNEPTFRNALYRTRKIHSQAIWLERLKILELADVIENRFKKNFNSSKKIALGGLDVLTGLKKSNAQKLIFFDEWWELKKIVNENLEDARQGAEKVRKFKDRMAGYTIWKK